MKTRQLSALDRAEEQHTEDRVAEGSWVSMKNSEWGRVVQVQRKAVSCRRRQGLVESLQGVFSLLGIMEDHQRVIRKMLVEEKWEEIDFNIICILQGSLFGTRFFSDSCFQILNAYFLINQTQENDSHLLIKYCDSN